jgi:hypothetical protein
MNLFDGQDFALGTAVADQDHNHFTGMLIHLGDQAQLIGITGQTFGVEFAKETIFRCFAWLIAGFNGAGLMFGLHPIA